ncbi:MAG: zf-HC2 domain-containing protein [Ruminococcus sp.]|uniref:anti-sigma factor family protein n=1 Tax=Ruminococcus sp. TaxID=41978 RepID=UPI0025D19CCD|nr:zf-HC2 domain-containing protein [Ruminococcus sp.]MBR5684017.1 zf-HC2 domain-containing protein [Ruminococcus sp.]
MKYDHEIIRDLMPLCIDGIASEKSRKAVEEHLAECAECKSEWEQMKGNIQPCENIPLPEDTAKYTATAKRVRKHHRWMLLKVTCAVIAALFVIGIIGNFIDGARFSPKSIAKQFIGEWCDLSEAKITFLGTVKSPDRQCESTFALVDRPGEPTMLAESTADRSDLLRIGMWSGTGGSIGDLQTDKAIIVEGGACSYDNGLKYCGCTAFYVTDKRIKKISYVEHGKTYTLFPDENGFCGTGYSIAAQYEFETDPFIISEGTATDENGKVLYEVQEVSKGIKKGKEYSKYDWVKVE